MDLSEYFYHRSDMAHTKTICQLKVAIADVFSRIIEQIDLVLSDSSEKDRMIEEELKSTPWKDYKVFSLTGQKPFWELSPQQAEQLLNHGLELLHTGNILWEPFKFSPLIHALESGIIDWDRQAMQEIDPELEETTDWYRQAVQEIDPKVEEIIDCYRKAMIAFRKAAPGCREAQYILVLVHRSTRKNQKIKQAIGDFLNTDIESMMAHNADGLSEIAEDIDEYRDGTTIIDEDRTPLSMNELEKLQAQAEAWSESLKAQCMDYYRILAQCGDLESAHKLLKMQKPHETYEELELAAELGTGKDISNLLQNIRWHLSEEDLVKWLQVQMNFDPSCATINAYQLTCLKNFHAQSVPDQKLRSLSPDAFLKIMGPVLPDAIKIEYDDAGRDLAQFTVYHEAWAREHKAQLLPFFENSRQIWIDFTPRQHAIDACNSLTPREQMRVDCKAAYQKAFLEVEDGTSSLPEFAAYQQLTVALQNDRLQTESPRTEMEIPLGSLVPSLCPAAGMDDAA